MSLSPRASSRTGSAPHPKAALPYSAARNAARDKPGSAKADRPLHILIVEDNMANQLVAQTMVRRAGHQTTLCMNGREAVRLCEQQRFDLILMDIEMPEMNGIEATLQIRHNDGPNRDTLIIALTAYGSASEKYTYRQSGIDHVLVKPFRMSEMAKAIAQFYQNKSFPVSPATGTENINDGAALGIDRLILAELLGGNSAQDIDTLLKNYWRSAYALIEELQNARALSDVHRLRKAAKALSQLSSDMGLSEISTLADHISRTRPDLCASLLDELDGAMLRARKALNEILRGLE